MDRRWTVGGPYCDDLGTCFLLGDLAIFARDPIFIGDLANHDTDANKNT